MDEVITEQYDKRKGGIKKYSSVISVSGIPILPYPGREDGDVDKKEEEGGERMNEYSLWLDDRQNMDTTIGGL